MKVFFVVSFNSKRLNINFEHILGNLFLTHNLILNVYLLYLYVLVDIPYCPKNEKLSKHFMKGFDAFTEYKCDIRIKWVAKKVKHLFKLKSRSPHPSCVIYEDVRSCQESYIGETVRKVEIRWQEPEDTQKDSEPAPEKVIQQIHLLGKFFSQPHQIDESDKTWKHQ